MLPASLILLLFLGCANPQNIPSPTPPVQTLTPPPTASLPPPLASQSTPTAVYQTPTVENTRTPVEGITTHQVNVRAAPSTASAALGLLEIFTQIQITGRDAASQWYRIVYPTAPDAVGWVRAEYIQVQPAADISPVNSAPSSSAAVSASILQPVNVRKSPGTQSQVVGILNRGDVLYVTSRDAAGEWVEVEFLNAPGGRGWVSAEYLQGVQVASLPTAQVSPTPQPLLPDATSTPMPLAIAPDGDSRQAPLAVVALEPGSARAFRLAGSLSAPAGDSQDWLQFTTQGGRLLVSLTCKNDSITTSLFEGETPIRALACGTSFTLESQAGLDYWIQLSCTQAVSAQYTLNVEIMP